MVYRTRTYYTDSQKALMWERWRQGWTLHQIAQLFNLSIDPTRPCREFCRVPATFSRQSEAVHRWR